MSLRAVSLAFVPLLIIAGMGNTGLSQGPGNKCGPGGSSMQRGMNNPMMRGGPQGGMNPMMRAQMLQSQMMAAQRQALVQQAQMRQAQLLVLQQMQAQQQLQRQAAAAQLQLQQLKR